MVSNLSYICESPGKPYKLKTPDIHSNLINQNCRVFNVSQRVDCISSTDHHQGPTNLFCLPHFTNEESEASRG